MTKIDDARKILHALGMPERQQADLCCYALLAMCNMGLKDKWQDASNKWVRIHDVLKFINVNCGVFYAENSRESIRKQAMHKFRDAALAEENGMPTNSPNYRYRITDEALRLIRTYGSCDWEDKLILFRQQHAELVCMYASKREMQKLPIKINSASFMFSSGKHNELQKAIIEEFAPRFAPSCECLYVGDSAKRDLYKNTEKLAELGFEITLHDIMPDVVLYRSDADWLYFIEAVTSAGPMTPERKSNICKMTERVKCGKIFITAFPNFKVFKKFSDALAWDTEVWLSDMPDHMIHLNGDKFLGPRM